MPTIRIYYRRATQKYYYIDIEAEEDGEIKLDDVLAPDGLYGVVGYETMFPPSS